MPEVPTSRNAIFLK